MFEAGEGRREIFLGPIQKFWEQVSLTVVLENPLSVFKVFL